MCQQSTLLMASDLDIGREARHIGHESSTRTNNVHDLLEPYTIEHACKRGISPSEHACIGVRTGKGLDALEHRHLKGEQTDAGGKSYEEKRKATARLEPTTKASSRKYDRAVNRCTMDT